jgi:phospholipase C
MPNGPIKKLFVLMLENRSFDNLFGWSDLRGWTPDGTPTQADGLLGRPPFTNRDRNGNVYTVGAGAPFQLSFDPGHEFSDVLLQLCGPAAVSSANCIDDRAQVAGVYPPIQASANDFGFAACAQDHGIDPAVALRCFAPDQLPVLNFLARQFALCDRWFSSMPGPTWPNRFFALAGTSWGLDHSPSDLSVLASEFLSGARYGNGSDSLLTRLAPSDWMVIAGDRAQAWALAGVEHLRQNLVHVDDFIARLTAGESFEQRYFFIEPTYDALPGESFRNGNSMHPLGDVRSGEELVKTVYEAILESRHWEECAFVVTFDEHGGFFDHVAPGPAVAPAPISPRLNKHGFGFDRYGMRVPTLVISPYVRPSTIDHTVYDHASLLKTVDVLFGDAPGEPIITNARIAFANSFERLFSLASARRRDQIPPCPTPVLRPREAAPPPATAPSRAVDAFQTLPADASP